MPACTPTRTLSAALSGQRWLVIARCAATAAASASVAAAKATTNESPTVFTSTPPCRAHTARSSSLCFSSSGRYAGPSWRNILVEPSMSVSTKVTRPEGRTAVALTGRQPAIPRTRQGQTAHHLGRDRTDGYRMDVRRFAECIERLTSAEIDAIAVAHRSLADSVSDEVEAWQVLFAVDRGLRAAHRSREAGLAAATARRLVVQAAERG